MYKSDLFELTFKFQEAVLVEDDYEADFEGAEKGE